VLSMKDGRLSPFGGVSGSRIATHATFSPDGRWVADQREGATNRELQTFVESFPVTGAKYLVPVKQAGHPFWSRDGSRLHLNQLPNTSVEVEVRTSPAVTFGQPRLLPRAGRYEPSPLGNRRGVDLLPDGRLIGLVLDVGDPATKPEFQVVLNWLPALTAKLAH